MQKKQNEKISVIVPVYKVEPYLKQCVDSILVQTYRDLEVILVDDGSPDNCGKICDAYAGKDSRIVVLHKKNGGLSDARNAGIERATGAYLAFVDSDDFVAPTMLEKLYQKMQDTDAELVLCNIQYTDEEAAPILGSSKAQQYELPEAEWTQAQFWERIWKKYSPADVVTYNKLYRRELFDTVRFPVGKVHEDEFILHQIIAQCCKIATLSDRLYFYRQRAGSIMSDPLKESRLDKIEAYLSRSEYFRETGSGRLLQKTVFDMIEWMEWFAYESKLAGKPLPERYELLKRKVIDFTKQPVKMISPLYWGVVLSYRWGIFPYAFIRKFYWSMVGIKKKLLHAH